VTRGKGAVAGNSISSEKIEAAMASREEEREADRFAVRFMVHAGLSVEPFVKFLLAAPDDQRLHYGLHTHDTREVRAKFIRDTYKNLVESHKIQNSKPVETK
jgi:predicted Zn-dependent protease